VIDDFILKYNEDTNDIVLESYIGSNDVDKLEITEGITEIASNCFKKTSISSFILPKSLKLIGEGCFYNSDIYEVVLNSTNLIIDAHAFHGSTVKHINLDNVISISESAFNNTYGLSSINLSNCKFIGKDAFKNSLVDSVVFSDDIVIEENAFFCCDIKSLFLNNASLGYRAFAMSHLKQVEIVGYISVSTGVFENCRYLESVRIDNLKIASVSLFKRSKNLINISLPNLEKISYCAFENVELVSLNCVKCKDIDYHAFLDCTEICIIVSGNRFANNIYVAFSAYDTLKLIYRDGGLYIYGYIKGNCVGELGSEIISDLLKEQLKNDLFLDKESYL
jgi:hypothetical protein